MLQYISLGEKQWRKCPICFDAINPSDLKRASFLTLEKLRGATISNPIALDLVLMKRSFVSIFHFSKIFIN
jgi:hypothetical protein